jgi:hypothetical protein
MLNAIDDAARLGIGTGGRSRASPGMEGPEGEVLPWPRTLRHLVLSGAPMVASTDGHHCDVAPVAGPVA